MHWIHELLTQLSRTEKLRRNIPRAPEHSRCDYRPETFFSVGQEPSTQPRHNQLPLDLQPGRENPTPAPPSIPRRDSKPNRTKELGSRFRPLPRSAFSSSLASDGNADLTQCAVGRGDVLLRSEFSLSFSLCYLRVFNDLFYLHCY